MKLTKKIKEQADKTYVIKTIDDLEECEGMNNGSLVYKIAKASIDYSGFYSFQKQQKDGSVKKILIVLKEER